MAAVSSQKTRVLGGKFPLSCYATGVSTAVSRAMIETTTRSSTSVNPAGRRFSRLNVMCNSIAFIASATAASRDGSGARARSAIGGEPERLADREAGPCRG